MAKHMKVNKLTIAELGRITNPLVQELVAQAQATREANGAPARDHIEGGYSRAGKALSPRRND